MTLRDERLIPRTETLRGDTTKQLIPRLVNAFQKHNTAHFCANARGLQRFVLSSVRIKKKKQSAFYAIIKTYKK